MRERGLKPSYIYNMSKDTTVAPHAGAWVETQQNKYNFAVGRSLPMRERGLKLLLVLLLMSIKVAPHAGAWVETVRYYSV